MSAGIRLVPVSLLVTLLVSCGDGTETIETPPTAEATNPIVLFDGTTCRYDGPSRVTAGGLTPIVLENTSDTDIVAGLFRVRNENSLQGAFDNLPPGTGSDVALGLPPDSVQEAWLQAPAGDRNEENVLLPVGWYLMDCARVPSGASMPDYVWRGGGFEVVTEE